MGFQNAEIMVPSTLYQLIANHSTTNYAGLEPPDELWSNHYLKEGFVCMIWNFSLCFEYPCLKISFMGGNIWIESNSTNYLKSSFELGSVSVSATRQRNAFPETSTISLDWKPKGESPWSKSVVHPTRICARNLDLRWGLYAGLGWVFDPVFPCQKIGTHRSSRNIKQIGAGIWEIPTCWSDLDHLVLQLRFRTCALWNDPISWLMVQKFRWRFASKNRLSLPQSEFRTAVFYVTGEILQNLLTNPCSVFAVGPGWSNSQQLSCAATLQRLVRLPRRRDRDWESVVP